MRRPTRNTLPCWRAVSASCAGTCSMGSDHPLRIPASPGSPPVRVNPAEMRRGPSNLTELARQRSIPLDHADPETLARIDAHGRAVMHILQPDGSSPAYSFSVGLAYRFQQPEVLMIGLPHDVMQEVINEIGRGMESGQRFREGDVRDDLLDGGYTCRLVEVHPGWHSEYVGVALWFQHWFDPQRELSVL